MANAVTNSIALGSSSNGILSRISTAIANYRMYSRTLQELRALSNRELQDLGLSRHSIRQVARDAVYGS